MNTREVPPLRLRLLLVSVPVVLLAGVAVLGEFTVRWREAHRTTPPGTTPTLFYRHERLRPALEHGANYFGWIHVDSSGMRGAPVAENAMAGTLRLLADGGSTTFDTQVSADDSTWPARVQRLLAGHRVADSVEVLNAGVPSYRVIDNLVHLQTDLYRFHPDIIVQMQGHNDLYDALVIRRSVSTSTTPSEQEAISGMRYWLIRHSLLYGKLEGAWLTFSSRFAGGGASARASLPTSVLLDRGAEQFRRDLTSYVLIARELGASVVLVEPVHVGQEELAPLTPQDSTSLANAFPGVTVADVRAGYRRYAGVIQAVAEATGAAMISTTGLGLDSTKLYAAGDPMHLTDDGSRRLAERIASALDSLGVLQARLSR